MTRFSEPKSIMRFISQGQALVGIHTPVGLQQFVTDTRHQRLRAQPRLAGQGKTGGQKRPAHRRDGRQPRQPRDAAL